LGYRNADDTDGADLHGFYSLALIWLIETLMTLMKRIYTDFENSLALILVDRNADDADGADLHGFYSLALIWFADAHEVFLQGVEGVKEFKGVFGSLRSLCLIGTQMTLMVRIYTDFIRWRSFWLIGTLITRIE
jgi:hypothetical protein